MKANLLPLIKRSLTWGVAITAFILPLIYTTSTVDQFEFPKQTAFYIAVLILLALWLSRFFVEGEVRIRKTPLDLPLLLFLGVVVVSTILSYNQIGLVSVLGFFGRFQGGLLSILAAVLFYYIAVTNLEERADIFRVLWAVVLSAALLAILGLTNALGFPLLGEANRIFTPAGSLASLGAYLAAALVVAIGMLLGEGTSGQKIKRAARLPTPERSDGGQVHALAIRGPLAGMKKKDVILASKARPGSKSEREGLRSGRSDKTGEEDRPAERRRISIDLSFWGAAKRRLQNRFRRDSGQDSGQAGRMAFPSERTEGQARMTGKKPPTLWLPPTWAILLTISSLIVAELALLNLVNAWIVLAAGLFVVIFWNRPSVLLPSIRHLAILVSVGMVMFLAVHVVGIGSVIPGLNPLEKEQTLDLKSSWIITANSVKDYPLFGSGPGTFLFDFTRYREQTFNDTSFWNLRFTTPHNEYFLYLSTFGILGLFAFSVVVIRYVLFSLTTALRGAEGRDHPIKVGTSAAAFALFVGMGLTAFSSTTFTLLFILLASVMALEKLLGAHWAEDLTLSLILAQPRAGHAGVQGRQVMPTLFFYPGMILLVLASYFLSRHIGANIQYKMGLDAAARNDGTATYNAQRRAIELNPWIDQYRLGFAQTNLLLANAIAGKQDPTDEDRSTITALLDQAVREARFAAEIAPLNVQNWEGLAQIYRSITGAVANAGDWALESYRQAMAADPPNPQLYLDAGGIYYAAQQFDPAILQFQTAVQLKPNFANAWYNLANAFKQKGMYNEALQAYQQTAALVGQGGDGQKVAEEIASVQEAIESENEESDDVIPATSGSPESQQEEEKPEPTPEPTPEATAGEAESTPEPTPEPTPESTPEGDVAGESTPSAE